MAKKSFVFNVEWQEILEEYPSEVRLEVYDAIIRYVASGTLSELKPMSKMAFSFIKKEIDYNASKYDEIVAKRSEAGKKGMKKRYGENLTNDNKTNKCYQSYQKVTNVTVNDNDNDNDIKKEKYKKEKIDFSFCHSDFISIYEEWIDYKKSKNQSYKSQKSAKACYNHLVELSDNNPEIAKNIVQRSIANNWSGIFGLKDESKPQQEQPTYKLLT